MIRTGTSSTGTAAVLLSNGSQISISAPMSSSHALGSCIASILPHDGALQPVTTCIRHSAFRYVRSLGGHFLLHYADAKQWHCAPARLRPGGVNTLVARLCSTAN